MADPAPAAHECPWCGDMIDVDELAEHLAQEEDDYERSAARPA